MIRSFAAVAFSMISVAAFATATLDPDTNILTFDVASGEETYSTALGSSIAGVVKTGAGKIILTAAATGFTGKPVAINGGVLEIQHKDALGSGNTVTVANGAQYRMVYDATQNDCGGQNNDIVLKGGDGPDHKGALYGTGLTKTTASDYFWGNVTLEADAAIGCGNARGFGKTLDLGGHTLSLVSGSIRLAGTSTQANSLLTVKNPGKIRLVSGQVCIQGIPVFEGNGTFEAAGGSIQMWNLANPVPWRLKVEDANLRIQMGSSLINKKVDPNCDVWSGDVVVGSGRSFSLYGNGASKADHYLTIAGNISGAGAFGIEDVNVEYRLTGTNTYSGGTTIGANRLRIYADGNVSTNGPVKINGGSLELHLEDGNLTSDYIEGLASQMSSAAYSSGRGSLRIFTGESDDITLSSDFSTIHPSIAICHEGMGSLTLSGEIASDPSSSGAMLRNTAGTFVLDGDCNRRLWSFNCSGGTMDVVGGSLWREYNNGNSDFRIGDSNDVSNARMRILNGGTLYFPSASGDASEPIKVDDLGTKPAILEICDGATVTAKVQVAYAEKSLGAVYQYGGDVFHLTRPGNDGAIGNFGQAYWWMEGGTFKSDNANPYLGLASKTGSESQFEVQGGTVSLSGANSLMICRGGASNAEFYMGGGTATINQIRLGGELTYAADKGADPGGQAVLTLAGTNNPSLTVITLRLNDRTNQFTSVVNLNAGLLTVSNFYDCTRTSETRKDCKSFVNFNGGAVRFNGVKDVFASGLPTRITVFGGGATIELTQSGDHYPSFSLLAPEGRGIKSITVPDGVSTEGYAMPPVAHVAGGGGDGATAHVRFDPRTGRIDREIEVTSPGWGFTEAPAVTITAPDMKTPVVCEVELTDEVQEDGGLTLRGSDSTARNFVPNSTAVTYNYRGPTVVEPGVTFYPRVSGVPNPFSTSKELRLAGGAYSAWNSNPTWRRLGGFGKTRSWDSYRLEVSEALFFRAQDLEQGLYIEHDTGRLKMLSDCVVEIDDLDALTGDVYTLVLLTKDHSNNYLDGTPKFAADVAAANPRWRLHLAANKKKLTLRRLKGAVFSLR